MNFSKVGLFHYINNALTKTRHQISGSDVPPVSPEEFDLRWEDIILYDEDFKYTDRLKESIAERYGISPEMVLLSAGCTLASFLTIAAIFNEDQGAAIIEKPVYTPLQDALNVFTHDVRSLPRWFEDEWALDMEELGRIWDPSVRLIVLTKINNPTGAYTTDNEIKTLAEYVGRSGGYVLVDEVFREFDFDAAPGCAAAIAPNVITVNSFTKTFGLEFLRFGWFIGPEDLIKKVANIADYFAIAGHFPASTIILRAFEKIEMLRERSKKYVDEGRLVFEKWLASRDELECVMPHAVPFAFPVLKDDGDADEIADKLLEEEGALIVPGRHFGYPPGFRLGWGTHIETLQNGLQALSKVLDERLS